MEKLLVKPETWVDEHGDYLFRYAFLRVRNTVIAEELVQETFLAALQAGDRFSGHSTERTWLTGILKHKVFDYFRKASREACLEEAEDVEDAFGSAGESAGHWNQEAAPAEWVADLDRQRFWTLFQDRLATLPRRMAHAFVLREIEEMSAADICRVLKITENNLWVLLHRARVQLRKWSK
jgi:RNA polymerase sigma-70 factor (ECF subfamily)